jgi:hypothetical protein
MDTQSRDRHAGTTTGCAQQSTGRLHSNNVVEGGGHPTRPRRVRPKENATISAATATADPETRPARDVFGSKTLEHDPYGVRTPTRPVANWSMFVCRSRSRRREQALHHRGAPIGTYANSRAGSRCGDPGDVYVVLDCERHTVQGEREAIGSS